MFTVSYRGRISKEELGKEKCIAHYERETLFKLVPLVDCLRADIVRPLREDLPEN